MGVFIEDSHAPLLAFTHRLLNDARRLKDEVAVERAWKDWRKNSLSRRLFRQRRNASVPIMLLTNHADLLQSSAKDTLFMGFADDLDAIINELRQSIEHSEERLRRSREDMEEVHSRIVRSRMLLKRLQARRTAARSVN
jgi:hypothetical protein